MGFAFGYEHVYERPSRESPGVNSEILLDPFWKHRESKEEECAFSVRRTWPRRNLSFFREIIYFRITKLEALSKRLNFSPFRKSRPFQGFIITTCPIVSYKFGRINRFRDTGPPLRGGAWRKAPRGKTWETELTRGSCARRKYALSVKLTRVQDFLSP